MDDVHSLAAMPEGIICHLMSYNFMCLMLKQTSVRGFNCPDILQNPFVDNSEIQQRTARVLSLNTWDVAVALTDLDWTIFDSMHEV